jgi:hypothetical protein
VIGVLWTWSLQTFLILKIPSLLTVLVNS